MRGSTTDYFHVLQRHLALDPVEQRELVQELRDHVDDRVAALVRSGFSAEQARRRALAGFGRPETLAHLIRQARLNARWQEALIAAAPAEVVAVILALGLWTYPVVAAGFATTVVGVTTLGLWRGRPVWFYPWAGVALTFPFLGGYFAFLVLTRTMPSAMHGAGAPGDIAGTAGALLYFPLGALVFGTALLVAMRRDWLDASVLLTPVPGALAWLVHVHQSGGLLREGVSEDSFASVIALTYATLGIATIAFLRAPTRRLRIATLVAGAVAVMSVAAIADAEFTVVALATRSLLLVGFLVTPAIVARRSD